MVAANGQLMHSTGCCSSFIYDQAAQWTPPMLVLLPPPPADPQGNLLTARLPACCSSGPRPCCSRASAAQHPSFPHITPHDGSTCQAYTPGSMHRANQIAKNRCCWRDGGTQSLGSFALPDVSDSRAFIMSREANAAARDRRRLRAPVRRRYARYIPRRIWSSKVPASSCPGSRRTPSLKMLYALASPSRRSPRLVHTAATIAAIR